MKILGVFRVSCCVVGAFCLLGVGFFEKWDAVP